MIDEESINKRLHDISQRLYGVERSITNMKLVMYTILITIVVVTLLVVFR